MNFGEKKVVVVGDSILDQTIVTKAVGLSLESPTLKTEEEKVEVTFGGAANVVNNILSLGGECTYVTPIRNDEYKRYFDNWDHENLALAAIEEDGRNTVKTRIWVDKAGEKYKYLQINRTETTPFRSINSLLHQVAFHIQGADVLVLVDYNLGVFEDSTVASRLISLAKAAGVPVVVSSQSSDDGGRYLRFKGADFFCMNQREANEISSTIGGVTKALGSPVCITLGDSGSMFRYKEATYRHFGYEVDCRDQCGAGDAFLASFALGLDEFEGNTFDICNAWAALSTTKIGTVSPTLKELYEFNESKSRTGS